MKGCGRSKQPMMFLQPVVLVLLLPPALTSLQLPSSVQQRESSAKPGGQSSLGNERAGKKQGCKKLARVLSNPTASSSTQTSELLRIGKDLSRSSTPTPLAIQEITAALSPPPWLRPHIRKRSPLRLVKCCFFYSQLFLFHHPVSSFLPWLLVPKRHPARPCCHNNDIFHFRYNHAANRLQQSSSSTVSGLAMLLLMEIHNADLSLNNVIKKKTT